MNDFLPLSRWATWRRGRCQERTGDADGHLGLALGSTHARLAPRRRTSGVVDAPPLPLWTGSCRARGAAGPGPEVPERRAPVGRVQAVRRTEPGVVDSQRRFGGVNDNHAQGQAVAEGERRAWGCSDRHRAHSSLF